MTVRTREPEQARSPLRYDNRITLQKLEVFCSVVELDGVSKAAEHLWVAQSVVSGHLRSLQERLGVQVLYRDGQKMKLTAAGERVYRWARETLSETRELMRHLEDLTSAENERLVLAASMTTGSYLLPAVLAEMGQDRPGAVITMSVTDTDSAFAAVASGECGMGIVIAEEEYGHPHLRCEEIGREEIALVVAANGFPGVGQLPLADVAALPLVTAPAGSRARKAVDGLLAGFGTVPRNVAMELGHPEAMKRVLRSGTAACLLFRCCVQDELAAGTLREIPVTDARLTLPVVSIVRADRRLPSLPAQLVERTRAHLAGRRPS
ncbi:transcriptional regulator, LysR family [Lentzea xinjiangensis]|uniref:Transcriptional regulator, LysR family n=1 Tax=Lentzea xinjiangensis TaxID=402600 RepID=A0A1H9NJ19_9PSEU|nr:LysR family transcriptional regulator [Lentzea xinjiangensis]SER35655.1 transcriptional regulator, LysR family [Lentzea xinjiangensis]